jgi:hypothetical protein
MSLTSPPCATYTQLCRWILGHRCLYRIFLPEISRAEQRRQRASSPFRPSLPQIPSLPTPVPVLTVSGAAGANVIFLQVKYWFINNIEKYIINYVIKSKFRNASPSSEPNRVVFIRLADGLDPGTASSSQRY